jgi:HlyD family secretion protein
MRHKALLLAAALVGCSRVPAPPAEDAAKGPVAVKLVAPVPAMISRTVTQPGVVQPDEEAHLVARLPGYVGKVAADIGKAVKAGDLLAELSVPEMEEEAALKDEVVKQALAEADQAEKALLAAEARVGAKKAGVGEAKAGEGRAAALLERWRSESERMSALVARGVMDRGTADETAGQYKASQADRDEARARVTSAEEAVKQAAAERDKAAADVAAMKARSGVARADARKTKAMLAYKSLRAPFDGVVTARHVDTGDFLQPSSQKVVFTVARIDPVRVALPVPEAEAAYLTEGLEVKLTIPALRPPTRAGKVARLSWSLDRGARTLRAEVDLPNKEGKLRPGMFVTASVVVALDAAWSLPVSAVAKQGDDTVAFQAIDGKASRTLVKAGAADEKRVEVLEARTGDGPWRSITGQERFIVEGAAKLSDGARVAVGGP